LEGKGIGHGVRKSKIRAKIGFFAEISDFYIVKLGMCFVERKKGVSLWTVCVYLETCNVVVGYVMHKTGNNSEGSSQKELGVAIKSPTMLKLNQNGIVTL
jgi:hypothetical protein